MEYLIVLVVLMVAAVVGWVLIRSRAFHVPNAVEADGEVVEVQCLPLPGINPLKVLVGKAESSVRYHPVVRFRLDKERLVRFRSRKGYKSEEQYAVGAKVKVLYSKDNPFIAKIKED